MAGNVPGPDPIINEALLKRIKECIIDGKNLQETANLCGLNKDSFYVWHSDNYLNLATLIEGWKRDRLILMAENNVRDILSLGLSDKDSLKVVQDTTKFVLETLKKDVYAKRVENTGANGKELFPKPLLGGESNIKSNVISNNIGDKKTIEANEEN